MQVGKGLAGEEWICGGGTAQRGRMPKGAVGGGRGREGGLGMTGAVTRARVPLLHNPVKACVLAPGLCL